MSDDYPEGDCVFVVSESNLKAGKFYRLDSCFAAKGSRTPVTLQFAAYQKGTFKDSHGVLMLNLSKDRATRLLKDLQSVLAEDADPKPLPRKDGAQGVTG